MSFTTRYMAEVARVAAEICTDDIDEAVRLLRDVRSDGGTAYVLGLGGSAANASHAAADLVNLAGVNAVSVDNMSWLTAAINDHGWDSVFVRALSAVGPSDLLLVFSVGGGSVDPAVSTPIVNAVHWAKESGAKVVGVTSPRAGETQSLADVSITVPASAELLTPMVESFQAVVWHLIVSHPLLNIRQPVWEHLGGR